MADISVTRQAVASVSVGRGDLADISVDRRLTALAAGQPRMSPIAHTLPTCTGIGLRKTLTPIRGEDRALVARWYLAHHTGRSPETISRHCTPVACDVRNRSLLYDVTASLAILTTLRQHPTTR